MYLREMGTVPLLTREGEVEIATPHRARQALGDQVDLAHAGDHQGGHPHGRSAEGRRAHHPRAGDLQRRRDHRRPHRGARAAVPQAGRRRAQGAPQRREARREARDRPEGRQDEVPPRALEGDARAGRDLALHPQDRVHRAGQAPPRRRSEGHRRARLEAAARARQAQERAQPQDPQAEAEGGRAQDHDQAHEGSARPRSSSAPRTSRRASSTCATRSK